MCGVLPHRGAQRTTPRVQRQRSASALAQFDRNILKIRLAGRSSAVTSRPPIGAGSLAIFGPEVVEGFALALVFTQENEILRQATACSARDSIQDDVLAGS